MGHIENLVEIGERLAIEYCALEGVEGFVFGGSVARGFADGDSDLEAYVYYQHRLPAVAEIECILARIGAHPTRSTNLHWTHPAWGTHTFFGTAELRVELGYRDVEETRGRVESYLAGGIEVRDGIHDVAFGWYPSGLASCLDECIILIDAHGQVEALKQAAHRFPSSLRDTLLGFHIAEAEGIMREKLQTAHERGDGLHYQAALARMVRSCVIGVFAVNQVHFPGDKWNRNYLEKMPLTPTRFLTDLDHLLGARASVPSERAAAMEVISAWIGWLKATW